MTATGTGCAEGSLLVRDLVSGDECTISATLAAARLSNLLVVPGGGPAAPPNSKDRT
ncbi:hypothetical protein [Streptomyces sp. MUM 2J]|uniref:hypothetical protein n=1 Tax=Streptomyces sp. MUM 2J TaxID=2791987 RepID=UPI001F03E30B|nr:hypothetical protein [Streptomyces sp. MUM 2J]MCH0566857.1 hypothetical protein [Streptomyces sp. MUM 2J]